MKLRIGPVIAGISGLAALLAVQGALAARSHQATAERVLVDYAALGAEGVSTRLQAFLASRLYPLLGAARSNAPLPAHVRPALLDSQVVRDIRAASTRLPDGAYFGMLGLGGELVIFPPSGSPALALPLDTIGAMVGRFLQRDPVLPSTLTRGDSVSADIGLSVTLRGRRLADRGLVEYTRFRAVDSLGAMYDDMAVEVRLAESLAPTLVIGGLPRSRLPFLAALMALALALGWVAVRQLRQQERLAGLREDFVAGTSHELRTPLAQIRLFAETLRLERVRSDEERTHALGVIEREARRLEHLVENLLHFSRAERGTLMVAPERVDLSVLTGEIVSEFAPLAEKAGATVRVEAPEAAPALVDPSAWRQVVLNLLDNAVKYGGPHPRVAVQVGREAGHCRLTVTDQGPGVPVADHERIWERFWRGETARAAGTTGTGIGLATVRELVVLLGGECRVEDAEGGGARFVVRIPAA